MQKTHKRYVKVMTVVSLIVLLAYMLLPIESHKPLSKTASYVDRDKFSGEWYIISNMPYFAEHNKVASKAIYQRRGPNEFDDIFESKDSSFDSPTTTTIGRAKSQ